MSRESEKRPYTVRKFLQKMYFRKYCYLTYTKAPEKLNSKKADNSIEKWDKDLNRQLTRENIQMAKKHMKRRSISYVIGKWNLKT